MYIRKENTENKERIKTIYYYSREEYPRHIEMIINCKNKKEANEIRLELKKTFLGWKRLFRKFSFCVQINYKKTT